MGEIRAVGRSGSIAESLALIDKAVRHGQPGPYQIQAAIAATHAPTRWPEQTDGNEMACKGVYLEVVPNQRLVFTDAYTDAWQPSQKPFMTVIVTFGTRTGRHATPRGTPLDGRRPRGA